ncbi:MAG: peptide chain release factor N(5)-glutamine methyltransferase [Clostridia bacterium]|nr:peptide chain release factor N(5)-glutamine methyltransferase [Clostridia bacterium]
MVRLLNSLSTRLNSRSDARAIIESVIGCDALLCRRAPTEGELERVNAIAERVLGGEMLAYVLGKTEFMSLPFYVNTDVLIPRQDTETLVEAVMGIAKGGERILDLCCGSGCIAISLSKYIKGAHVTGADISAAALDVARRNAALNGVDAEFVFMDVFGESYGEWDIIVSNPPYISSKELQNLSVARHEPLIALCGGDDGLDFYRALTRTAKSSYLAMEIGYNQAEAVKALCEKRYSNVEVIRDYLGNDRVIIASH